MLRKAIPIMVPATSPMRIPTPATPMSKMTMVIKNGTQEPMRKPILRSTAVRMANLRLRAGIVRKNFRLNP